MDTSEYEINYFNSSIRFARQNPGDSIVVEYRTIPFDLQAEIRKKPVSLISAKETVNPFSYVPQREKIDYLNDDKINTLGAISRGIGFGNQQDVVVNSNLNLKVNGRLNNKIDVLAAISDQNNPIQADGNTQQLQDFDRVFVQFRQDSGVLTLGDFDMFTPAESYFINYRKRSRGLQFDDDFDWKGGKLKVEAEAAVSRGRFSRNTIEGSEGNQGPYRLSGTRGEQFIIVIAGTESVFIDGKKLTRGEQNDYVINYNTGEIIFTPKQLITRYSRIVVEFQYSDRNYGRSVVHSKGRYQKNKWDISAHYFSEFDNKNQPFQQSLDIFDSINMKSARQTLAEAGDVEAAFIPKIAKSDVFNTDRIMYQRKDSGGYTFYAHVIDPELEVDFYEVTYSYVGSGNGNYRQVSSTANGKVFAFIPPVGGILQGDYEPVELLAPPVSLQVISLRANYHLNEESTISFELAQSNNDLNTFSDLNSDDDVGYGMNARWHTSKTLKGDSLGRSKLNAYASYELKDANFRPVERYRDVEFQRTWNRSINNVDGNELVLPKKENIVLAGVEYLLDPNRGVRYDFSYYDPSSEQVGIRNLLKAEWTTSKSSLVGQAEQMTIGIPMDTTSVLSEFLKYKGAVSRKIRNTRLGGEYWVENSEKQIESSQELEQTSYAFEEYSFFIQKADSAKFNYALQVRNREDKNATTGILRKFTQARDVRLSSSIQIDRFNSITLTSALRELEYLDTSIGTPSENTLQGRFEYSGRLFKRAIRTNMFYELGTGQEPRKEFSFIQVGDGNGNFIWNDYDSNGVQSLDEFEVASNLDIGRANFIRQFLPVQGFVKSYTNRFSHFVRIQPSVWWRNKKSPVLKGLSRFADVNTIRIDKKVTDNQYEVFLNPFSGVNADTTLVSQTSIWRNTVYFDQSNPKYGAEFSLLKQSGKLFLFNGFDSRAQSEYTVKFRFNLDKSWNTTIRASKGDKNFISDYLSNRNYDYGFVRVEPKLSYQYQNKWRLGVFYQQFEADNAFEYGGESSLSKELGLEGKLTMLNKGVVQGNFSYVNINYSGDPSTAVSYELLRGLKDGVNWKWNAQIDYRFENDIQLLFSYEGRKSELINVIHIGRLQARYLF